MSNTASDLPCGCRIIKSTTRLCSYHEGYEDGYEEGYDDGYESCIKTPIVGGNDGKGG